MDGEHQQRNGERDGREHLVSTSRLFFKRTKRGRVARLLREHYVRTNAAEACLGALPVDASHFVLPDPEVTRHFLELFEFELHLTHLVWTDTALQEAKDILPSRAYHRLRAVTTDLRRAGVVFNNEHFAQTYVAREPSQTLVDWQEQSIIKAASFVQAFIRAHCQQQTTATTQERTVDKFYSPHLIILSVAETLKRKAEAEGIAVMTPEEYVASYFSSCKPLIDLCESLSQLYQQKKLAEENKPRCRNGKDKENMYEEYRSEDELTAALKSGAIYKGVLHVYSHNHSEACVRLSESAGLATPEIFIPDKKHRNRAIHGDSVAVELIPKDQWSAPSSMIKHDYDDEESVEGAYPTEVAQRMPTGKIIGIFQRNWRPYVTTVQEEGSNESQKIELSISEALLTVPMDVRIPKIRIRTRYTKQIVNQRLVISIDDWDTDSAYPNGHIVRQLGIVGDLETEIQAILVENGLSSATLPFAPSILAALPSATTWTVPPDEIKRRKDIRESHRVYSIDPIGCQDIDDALSLRFLPDEKYELGVHIADVTYFYEHGSLLDIEARTRATTIYLADRRLDMIPPVLSEQLCSLRGQVDRLAVSVFWTLDKHYQVESVWYGRTVMRSVREMYYEQAQAILDGTLSPQERAKLPDYSLLEKELRTLLDISRSFNERRAKNGALELASTETRFELNEVRSPVKLLTKQDLPVHGLVAEFMIFANAYVAQQIHKAYPTSALLRRHPFPRVSSFKTLIECAAAKGFAIDISSNKALAQSLNKANLSDDPWVNHLLRQLATQAMSEAQYFSTGEYEIDQFMHYGLALNMYTHFTSPIRRYADVIVHRQLLASLEVPKATPIMNNEEVSELASHINKRHRASKNVQKDSSALFQPEDALIYGIKANGLLVFLPKFGLKGTIYLRDKNGQLLIPPGALPLPGTEAPVVISDFTFDQANQQIILHTTISERSINAALALFDHVVVRVSVSESRSHRSSIKLTLVRFGFDPHMLASGPQPRINVSKEVIKINQQQQDLLSRKVLLPSLKRISLLTPSAKQKNINQPEHEQDFKLYRQSDSTASIYSLCQAFRDMSCPFSSDDRLASMPSDTGERGRNEEVSALFHSGHASDRRISTKREEARRTGGGRESKVDPGRDKIAHEDYAVRRWRRNDLKKARPWFRTIYEEWVDNERERKKDYDASSASVLATYYDY